MKKRQREKAILQRESKNLRKHLTVNSYLLKGVATMAELTKIPDSHWVRLNPQIKW